jgi:hypothetical protein
VRRDLARAAMGAAGVAEAEARLLGDVHAKPPAAIAVYTERWWALAVFSVMSAVQNAVWISFSVVVTYSRAGWPLYVRVCTHLVARVVIGVHRCHRRRRSSACRRPRSTSWQRSARWSVYARPGNPRPPVDVCGFPRVASRG